MQAGAYSFTRLFESLGSDEKAVGTMLMFTALATWRRYFGHLADVIGRVKMLCVAIATLSSIRCS